MPSTRGFTATLSLDSSSTPLPEYGLAYEPSYASSYIVASSHSRFSITVAGSEFVHPAVDIAVWIDGVYQDGRIMQRLDVRKGWEFRERFTGKEERGRRGMVKKLWRFGEVSVVDEMSAECENNLDVLHNLGTIEVVVLRCNNAKAAPGDSDDEEEEEEEEEERPQHPRAKKYWNNWEADQNPLRKKKPATPVVEEKPIWETHLKGRDLRHRVVTEKEFAVRRKFKEKTVEYLDSFENPYAILVMHYRSKAALQGMGIVPRSPGASPSPSEDEETPEPEEVERLERLSREEILRELLALKKSQAAKAKAEAVVLKIKQEEQEEQEEMGRARKRTKVKREFEETGEEVVDLTAD